MTNGKNMILRTIGLIVIASLSACSDQVSNILENADAQTGRWYTQQQVAKGEVVYNSNCISCHNAKARGTFNWKKRLDDGSYPPPPLNGSAHAWHHPLPMLFNTINEGGIPLGGKMPPFKDVLTDEEKLAVISYFQSFWKEDIYKQWLIRNQPQ